MKFKEFKEALLAIQDELTENDIHPEFPSDEELKAVEKEDRQDIVEKALLKASIVIHTKRLKAAKNAEEPSDTEKSDFETPIEKADNEDEYNSIEDTLKERGTNYGKFKDHAKLSQKLKTTFDAHVMSCGNPALFTDDMNEAIEMIFHKLARIANGDPTYDDSWRDISGYSTLIVKQLNGEEV